MFIEAIKQNAYDVCGREYGRFSV